MKFIEIAFPLNALTMLMQYVRLGCICISFPPHLCVLKRIDSAINLKIRHYFKRITSKRYGKRQTFNGIACRITSANCTIAYIVYCCSF